MPGFPVTRMKIVQKYSVTAELAELITLASFRAATISFTLETILPSADKGI
jgi:hypothetical protein